MQAGMADPTRGGSEASTSNGVWDVILVIGGEGELVSCMRA